MSSIANIAGVFRSFGPDRAELSVTEAATLLAIPKSSTSRLLKAMAEQGLLEQAAGSRRYRPGPLVIGLGKAGRGESRLIDRLQAMLADVVQVVGHTGYVSIRDGLEIFGVRMVPGWQDLRVARPAGTRMPAVATAVGRALLARLSDAALVKLLPETVEPVSPSAPASRAEVLARIAQARQQGWSEAEDEGHRGIGTIAVVVLDPATDEAASACVTYPITLMTEPERVRLRALLTEAAARLGAELGDPAWLRSPTPASASPTHRRRAS
ncbi:MAG TPA: IclR family transcriptional regulator [Stellaceae bacterium]|nr:IclR family transcriptional regulator [Stellaceae bacterium]